MSTPRTKLARRALIAAVLAGLTRSTLAQSFTTWQGASGNWSQPSNWSPIAPQPNYDAIINNNDSIQRDITLDITTSFSGLVIGNTGGGITTLNQNDAHDLNIADETLGSESNSIAIHSQSAGNNIASVILGSSSNSTGIYNLSGSGTVWGMVMVGYNGYGCVNQSGGAVGSFFSSGARYVGFNAQSTGIYNLSGTGTLTINGPEYIGEKGFGEFNQSGGTHTIGPPLGEGVCYLGHMSGSTGIYDLSGAGVLNANDTEHVGWGGFGSFNQTGGIHNIGQSHPDAFIANLILGELAGSTGMYNLSGSGTLHVYGSEQISRGAFNQSGGSHIVKTTLLVDSTYTLSGNGSLNAKTESVFGVITQSGGSNVASTLNLSGSYMRPGIYSLSGDSTLSVLDESIGNNIPGYTGIFNQSGGIHTIGNGNPISHSLRIESPYEAVFNLSGTGTLIVNAHEFVGYSRFGTFNQTGGAHTIGTTLAHQDLYVALQPGSAGSYILNGATALFTVNGSAYLGGVETFSGGIATLAIQAGAMSVSDTLKTYDTLYTFINITGGSLTVGNLVDLASGSALTISGTGNLDLTKGHLILHSSPPNLAGDYTTLRNYLLANQIRSSFASSTTTLALMKSADYLTLHPGATFSNQTLTQTDLLIKYTYTGDADLSGSIDLNDYSLLEAAFLLGNFDPITNPASWVNGDFNNDGKIDMTDFALIDNAFLNQSGTLATDEITQHAQQFGTTYLTALQSLTPIPEPTTAALLSIVLIPLLRRKRLF